MRRIEVLLQLFLVSAAAVGLASVAYVGAWRWTAPVVCPDHQRDGFVVSDDDGIGVRYSLFCMGEGGDYREVGVWRPMAVLLACSYGLVVVGTLVWWRRGRARG